MSDLPSKDDLQNLVTWESLENALKGIRDDLQPQERVVIEMSSQTEVRGHDLDPTRLFLKTSCLCKCYTL